MAKLALVYLRCCDSLLPLNQASGHEKPLEGLDSHESIIVKDRKVFDLLLCLLEKITSLLRNDIIACLTLFDCVTFTI